MRFKGGTVIGHDAPDPHTVRPEEAQGIAQEDQAGQARFIREHFGIGQAGMVIHNQMQDFPSRAALVALALAIAGDAVTDPVNPAQLFGIDMDHIAGIVLLPRLRGGRLRV